VWQKLYAELKDQNFMVISVAMESRGNETARGPIEKSKSTYVSLIDTNHLVADLYNMVNVPQAVWIDEAGKIVRPTEVSGMRIGPKMFKARALYLDAIRDWVKHGENSQHVYSPQEARQRMPAFTEDIALAHANFHLGQFLWNNGQREEAAGFLEKATELNPDSWNFFRQMKNLEALWGSAGPAFMKRAFKAGREGKDYYPLADISGMKELFGK
jgi:tetratricopeptide (TPR) repeat protein